MSRASAVKKAVKKKPVAKKPVAKQAVKAVKRATKAIVPKARKPVKSIKPVVKATAKVAKPASKIPKATQPAAKVAQPASKAAKAAFMPAPISAPTRVPEAVAPRSESRYAGMTESDLKRAPASQYMNSGQLAFFREQLLAMQRELLEKADVTSEHLREHDIEPDPTDQATIEEEYALELRARDRERKLLKKIEQALRRIDEGSYGYCEETGEPIGIPRLLARPTATLSIEAQARREMKQKLYGD
jgi:DnaK suppressor protein